MGALLRLALALFSAFSYRYLRGGGIPLGRTQLARACWAVTYLALACAYAAVATLNLVATPLFGFLALIATGHGEHQDLGRGKAGSSLDGKPYEIATWPFRRLIKASDAWPFWARELLDAALMSWIGALRGVVATIPTAGDPVFTAKLILGNALMGPAYWIGYRIPWTLPGLAARSTEWGELLTGFGIALLFLFSP